MVREALARKSMIGVTVDRIVAVFIPGVLLLALATAAYWAERAGMDAALMTGLAVLVVACPCSLGLAAPLANTLAIGAAAQRGIVVRGGGVLEKLARIAVIAFDKTGTLTEGELRPHSIRVDGATAEGVMHYARALARSSDHPVARAITTTAAHAHGPHARRVEARPGAGMRGEVDGVHCALGTAAWMAAQGWTMPGALAGHGGDGGTRAFVGWDGRVRGCILFADTPRADAPQAIGALQRRGLRTLLASGDAAPAVAPLAAALGVEHWYAELMPEDKLRLLRQWIRSHGAVAMVGDGINDGPVLAAASVGIAVGAATDLAKESADVILPRGASGLLALPWLLELAANARRSLLLNLGWAFGYNAVALALAATGMLQPVLAAALMAGSSMFVVLRSWRAGAGDRSR
jgi:Cu2+-exporting ATPase